MKVVRNEKINLLESEKARLVDVPAYEKIMFSDVRR
jgi:hypothetical protein